MARFMPSEMQRKITDLTTSDSYKMRVARNFATYMIWPVCNFIREETDEVSGDDRYGTFLVRMAQRLFHGIRLVAGFSALPAPEENRIAAKKLFEAFLIEASRRDLRFCGFAPHNCVHVFEDMAKFECHLDFNSAYVFEGFHQDYKDFVKPGNHKIAQLV
jgi:hypothetical protein